MEEVRAEKRFVFALDKQVADVSIAIGNRLRKSVFIRNKITLCVRRLGEQKAKGVEQIQRLIAPKIL